MLVESWTNAAAPLYSTIKDEKPEGCYFDESAVERVVGFFSLLKHTQGPLAGQRFDLSPEQHMIVREAFGWMRADGTRLYRTIYMEVGRGNGKSQFGAGIAGYLLYADREPAAEVVSAASDREQAGIVLNRLKAMVEQSTDLNKRTHMFRKEIRVPKTGAVYKTLSADATAQWGGSPHGIIFDEVHAQPNRELWDALLTGTGKRVQPMTWAFTTAGWDRESLCWELHEYTRQIAEGTISDPSFLGIIYAAPEDADWTSPEVWKQANPVVLNHEFLAAECERAKNIPAFQNTFRTMYLSQWVGQETRFLDMTAWDRCGGELLTPSKPVAFGGMDLSATTDLTSFVVITTDGDIHVRCFLPAEGIRDRERRDRVPYSVWAREGLLTLTPGSVIDYSYVKSAVLDAAEKFDLRDVNYDRWNASQIVQELEAEGVTMVQMGQGYSSMSAPTKELLRLVLEGKVRHAGHPILRWAANNTAALTDAAGNIKPDKAKSTGRIDPIVALIMAIDGWQRRGRETKRVSVYEKRPLFLA